MTFKKIILILITLISIQSFAQEHRPPNGQGKQPHQKPSGPAIAGKVIDSETQTPVEYANIVLFSIKDSSLVTGGISDISGKFMLENIPFGTYYLTVDFIGYSKKYISNIEISQSNPFFKTKIELKKANIELGAATIKADKKPIEYKIDKKVINVSQSLDATGGSAIEVLENTPSIETDIEGNVSLRGSSSFTVLIDGKPTLLDPSDALQQIPASNIEKIEVITNPSAKYDPDGVAGIINVILKKQKQKGFNGLINSSISDDLSYKAGLLLNLRKNKYNLFFSADFDMNNHTGISVMNRETFYNDSTYLMDVNSDMNRFRGHNMLKGGIEYFFNDKNTFTFSTSVGTHKFGHTMDAEYKNYTNFDNSQSFSLNNNDFEITGNMIEFYGTYQHVFKDKEDKLDASFLYSYRDGYDTEDIEITPVLGDFETITDTIDKTHTIEDDDRGKTEFKIDYVNKLNANSTLETGGQILTVDKHGTYEYKKYDFATETWNIDASMNNDMSFTREIYAVYGMFKNANKIIDFQAGVRIENSNRLLNQNIINKKYEQNRFNFFPSIHISKKISDKHQLMTSYSRRIKRPRGWYLDPFPNFFDQSNMRQGNPDLDPEYIDSYELGYQITLPKGSFIAIEAYFRQTNNKIERITTLLPNNILMHTFENLTKDQALGVEFMANAQLLKFWRLNFSMNVFNYSIEGDIIETDATQTMNTWSMRLNNSINLKWGTKIQLSGFYTAPSITSQGDRAGFFMTHMGAKQSFFKNKLDVSIGIRDIFSTMKHEFTKNTSSYHLYHLFDMDAPSFSIELTYKINNYKPQRQKRNSENDGYDESGF